MAAKHAPWLRLVVDNVDAKAGPEQPKPGPERPPCEPGEGPPRASGPGGTHSQGTLAPDWRALGAAAVAASLNERGQTGGNAARWWKCSPRTARKVLAGEKPLSVEKLLALPERACLDALDALARLKRAA